MSKLSLIAATAILSLAFVGAASAASNQNIGVAGIPPGGGNPGGGGDNGACTVLCSPPPGQPDNPGNPGNPGDPGNSAKNDAAFTVCSNKLSSLRRVTVGEVRGIGAGDTVIVVPVCENRGHSEHGENQMSDAGNTNGLTTVLASNPVIVSHLGESRHKPEDVVGIIVNGKATTLYVHRFN